MVLKWKLLYDQRCYNQSEEPIHQEEETLRIQGKPATNKRFSSGIFKTMTGQYEVNSAISQ